MMEAPNITCPNCEGEMDLILQDEQKSAWVLKYKCLCGFSAKVLLFNSGNVHKYIYNVDGELMEYRNG